MSTLNIHHLGLAVKDLNATSGFFTEVLAFNVVHQLPDYPARFVSNGHAFVTLWQTQPEATAFDRNSNIGLHHFALNVATEDDLQRLYKQAIAYKDVQTDFAPEPLGEGPAQHCMFFEPGGIRIELIWAPAN